MELICREAERVLRDAGLAVQAAMPPVAAQRLRQPVVTLCMRQWTMQGRPVYLGLYENGGEQWELYGHRMEGKLEMTAHCPTKAGAGAATALAAEVASVLLQGIDGLTMRQVEAGSAAYDAALDCFLCPVTATVEAWLYAIPRDNGLYFDDFVLRGHLLAQLGQEERT